MAEGEKIVQINIAEEMKSAYIDYSMSVIVSRALPDVRDGLKPVHRRVLYGMLDLGVLSNRAYKKSARIVGEVLGKYHPHGDSSVYDTMVRMAQHWSLRYPMVDGQGNFGSIDGDNPAAMLHGGTSSEGAEDMLADLDKETVDFRPNFDESLKEHRPAFEDSKSLGQWSCGHCWDGHEHATTTSQKSWMAWSTWWTTQTAPSMT